MKKHVTLPTIVVVDSDKDPDDQLRTMIVLYRPPSPDKREKKSPKNRNKNERVSRTNSFKQKKSDMFLSISENEGRTQSFRDRQGRLQGRLQRRNSEERGKNRRISVDPGSFQRSRPTERKRQKQKCGPDSYHRQKLLKQKSTSQDSLVVKKEKLSLSSSKWKSDGSIDQQHSKSDKEESESEGRKSFIFYKNLMLLLFPQMMTLLLIEAHKNLKGATPSSLK